MIGENSRAIGRKRGIFSNMYDHMDIVLCSLHLLNFGATNYLIIWSSCVTAHGLWRRSRQKKPGELVLKGDRRGLRLGQNRGGGNLR